MAYDVMELEKKAIEAATNYNCLFTDDIIAHLGISRQTFYNHNLDKLDNLKAIIENNKYKIKNLLRTKWAESDNATTQIVLYKLCATDEELKLLNPNQRNENINLNLNVDGDIKSMSESERLDEIERIRKLLN